MIDPANLNAPPESGTIIIGGPVPVSGTVVAGFDPYDVVARIRAIATTDDDETIDIDTFVTCVAFSSESSLDPSAMDSTVPDPYTGDLADADRVVWAMLDARNDGDIVTGYGVVRILDATAILRDDERMPSWWPMLVGRFLAG